MYKNDYFNYYNMPCLIMHMTVTHKFLYLVFFSLLEIPSDVV